MKAAQKIIGRLIVGCCFACCLPLFTSQTLAIEGLQITIASTNAVLTWPSDSSETYIVQYRHWLKDTNGWITLADFYPPDFTTNLTYFIDTNQIEFGYSSGGGTNGSSGGGSPPPPVAVAAEPTGS